MIIRYDHRAPQHADTTIEAKSLIRDEAMRMRGAAAARADVVFVRADDGIYAYLDQDAADADQTGAQALAVIDSAQSSY